MRMAANVLLRALKEEITCPLCLDTFKRPKKLPCDHVYCQECLQEMARAKRATISINCPECRAPAQMTSLDFSNFPTAFHINRLVETYETAVQGMENTDGTAASSVSRVDKATNCVLHASQPLTLYCETCEKLVCRDCVLFSCAKAQHSYGHVEDLLEKHRSAVSDKLFTVKELQQRTLGTLDLALEFDRRLDREEGKVVQKVEADFTALFEVLREEKANLTSKLKRKFQDSRFHNATGRRELSAVRAQLEAVSAAVNPNETGSSFFANLKSRTSDIEEAIESALGVENPLRTIPDAGFSVLQAGKLRELCKASILTSEEQGSSLEYHFEGEVEWNNLPLDSTHSVLLCLHTSTAVLPKLEAHLYCVYSEEKHPVDVIANDQCTPKSYTLVLKPRQRGRHMLHIKCRGKHINLSPVQVHVTVKTSALRHNQHYVEQRFHNPMGVKCNGGRVYVSELGKGLAILEARTLTRVSNISMPGIWEVYLDLESSRLYGTDSQCHTLTMFNLDAQILKITGGEGNQQAQFHVPNGIRCSKSNELFVCDTMNNRLQVFDKDLNLLRVIDNRQFRLPDDLDFDEAGCLYVANERANNIVVLTPHGAFIRALGSAGSGLGQLKQPISVAVSGNLVYVTDSGNGRISVFTTEGDFVSVFGEGVLRKPECVAVDQDGYIYVTDSRTSLFMF